MTKIYFVFIIALLVVLLTSTATFCSECRDTITAPESTSGQDTGAGQEPINETAKEDSDSNSTETEDSKDSSKATDDKNEEAQQTTADSTDKGDDEATQTTAEQKAPAITLEISEGPIYSSADDVCYYRIKAVVSGMPQPQVTFSKDDSNGAWGEYITQVNFTQQGQTYTLTATAENIAGSASASMDLNWGCSQGGSQATDPDDDDDGFLFDSDLIITKKPIFQFPGNEPPVLNQSIQEPSGTLKVGQVFQIRCEGYDPDGDDFEALMAYSPQELEFIEKVSPVIYKWKALKAGNPTIDTILLDEHGEYSYDIFLTLNVIN